MIEDYRIRRLDDGRALSIVPLLFGRARVAIGPAHGVTYDDVW